MDATADLLARLRVATETERLPRELGAQLVELVERLTEPRGIQRTRRRNDLLRKAAELISGTAHARALRIYEELEAVGPRDGADGVRDLVLRAMASDPWGPRVLSVRQILRVLND